MAPIGSRSTRTRRERKVIRKTTIVKKPHTTKVVMKPKQKALPPSPQSSPCKSAGCLYFDAAVDDDVVSDACSTPKAERFQLPKNVTCPAAPKKPTMKSKTCFFRRSPIAFFAPPDLELFFY